LNPTEQAWFFTVQKYFLDSVENIDFSCPLSKTEIKIHKTANLPVLYGHETWSLHLKERIKIEGVSKWGAKENIFT
jgi:hypothetical protein